MSTSSAVGTFTSWTGGCLFIGESSATIPEHAHYAIQIAFGVKSGIRFRTEDRWAEYGGAIIPSRQAHSTDATRVGMSAVLLIEPETPHGRALTKQYLQHGVVEVPAEILRIHAPLIFGALRAPDANAALQEACQHLIQALTSDVGHWLIIDERLSRAIAFINENLAGSLTLDSVASEVCLSPSRFRHVFVEATGMPFRLYVLWRRFVRVWELLSGGASLSTAAHAAGFADAAHLSRTSRSMFGIPPSMLQIEQRRPSRPAPTLRGLPRSFTPGLHIQTPRPMRPSFARVA